MIRLFHFILSHSIFISLCAAALSLQTLLLLSLPVNSYLIAFIFFATLAGYNAYWMLSRFSFNVYTTLFSFLQNNKRSILVMLSAIAGMLFFFVRLQLVMYNLVITFILLCLYAMPMLPVNQLQFLRKAGFIKTTLLAFTWAMVTTLVPMQISIININTTGLMVFLNRFLFMLTLCIIFDKRDVAMDKIRGLKSLATDIKPVLLNYFVCFVILAYAIISVVMSFYGIKILQVAALLLTGLFTLWVYKMSLKKRGYLFYYFLVDGLMFLSGMFTLLASI